MKKILFLLLLVLQIPCFGQFMQETHFEEKQDSIRYEKSIEYAEKREFTDNLKEKYFDSDFQYTEDKEEVKEETPVNSAFLSSVLFFISKVFPFLLGAIIVFIILKSFLGTEIGFWNFKSSKKKATEKLVYEDEDIHDTDIDGLLQQAILNKQYRLAVRYYYLSTLKMLSSYKLIDYHKDKTNSEYLFELENETTRSNFKYLSYVYSYVWYGEFPIDEINFKQVETKYKSFKNTLK